MNTLQAVSGSPSAAEGHHLTDKVVRGGLAVLTAVTMAACTAEAKTTPAPTATPSGNNVVEPFDCSKPTVITVESMYRANRCREAMTGSIALVGFGAPQELLAEVADSIEVALRTSTGGLIGAEVVPIQASEGALDWYNEKLTDEGCVEGHIASELPPVMIEPYQEHGFVVAALPDRSCDPIGGGATGGRSDIYGIKPGVSVNWAGYVGTHEIAHVFLGHSSETKCINMTPAIVPGDGESRRTTLDVVELAELCEVESYSDSGRTSDVMGEGYRGTSENTKTERKPESATMNPVHKDVLRWPGQVLDGIKPQEKKVVDEPVELSRKDYETGTFAVVNLDTSITLNETTLRGEKVTHTYSKIVVTAGKSDFEPKIGGLAYIPGDIFLIDETDQSVVFFWQATPDTESRFLFGSQTVDVVGDQEGLVTVSTSRG